MTTKVRTRVLVLSDTHARKPMPQTQIGYAFREPLPKADIAIHCGDLTMNGRIDQHEAALALLKDLDAEVKVVIPGNHDLTLDTGYYSKHGNLYGPRPKYTETQLEHIRSLYTGPEAKSSGICYLEEGIRTLNLKNGAEIMIYASAYTPEFCQWGFAYPLEEDRFNPMSAANPIPVFDVSSTNAVKRSIDIVITHGPPHTILDKTARNENVGCPHLLGAISRSRPLLHCFGHIHEAWGAVRKTWPTSLSENIVSGQESSPGDAGVARLNMLKQEQTGVWARTHAQHEQQVEVDMELMLDDRGASIDATDLRRGEETLFVNASIMSLQYQPVQSPWVVDLMLDYKTEKTEE